MGFKSGRLCANRDPISNCLHRVLKRFENEIYYIFDLSYCKKIFGSILYCKFSFLSPCNPAVFQFHVWHRLDISLMSWRVFCVWVLKATKSLISIAIIYFYSFQMFICYFMLLIFFTLKRFFYAFKMFMFVAKDYDDETANSKE